MSSTYRAAVWFPAVRTGTGTDVFTERLAESLERRGIRSEITWLPLRAEYAPWTVSIPAPPKWAKIAHVNSWLHPRFLPKHLPVLATIHHAIHHPDVLEHKNFARAMYHRSWIMPNERRLLQRADQIVAVSQFVAKTAKKALIDVPMKVIYNGVDTELFRPSTRLKRDDESFCLLYVGGWKKLKGVDLLAPIMHKLGDGFHLCYTGQGAARNDRAAPPANMHDLGRLSGDEAVVAAMQYADALLFPSRSEGFGLVAAEAMAYGLPVIAVRGSSLVEVVEDGETGILCRQDDIAAFATACHRLKEDPELRCAMSTAARERAVRLFSIDKMVDAYVETYAECVAAGMATS